MLSGKLKHTIIRITTTELLLFIFFPAASLEFNFIQMKTLSVWICGLLFTCLTGAHGHNQFPENFVVANKANPVTLTCGAKADGAVTWKFEDEMLEDLGLEENFQQDDQNLTVKGVDSPLLGNYSCWRGEEMLSLTSLLLEADVSREPDSLISCRAKSYDCNFSCTWNDTEYSTVRLGLGNECSEGGKLCAWVYGSEQPQSGRLQFELSHTVSPYAEESTMLEVTAEAIKDLSILRTTKRFYLRDIIQPDSPQIIKCQEVEQELNVTIDPPSSWSTPHSFFSLEHQIEYVFKDNGKTGHSSSTLIPKGISKLRVRSRDSLVLSAWSQWTPWKNVRGRKKNRCKRPRETQSPKLPSVHHCKKTAKKNEGKVKQRHKS